VILLLLVAVEAPVLAAYVTRFTQEILLTLFAVPSILEVIQTYEIRFTPSYTHTHAHPVDTSF